ncbi:MAG: N-acetylneuraminate synthase family protein [Deltaproteobacteria bacterium]|nr:N-acetylneuraminate synthase family protein [Deltaproteobacteria bacterium]
MNFFLENRSKPYLIAEAGVNHNGNVEIARNLTLAAAESGADAIKFQMFHPEKLVIPSAQKAKYQVAATSEGTQLEMLRKLVLPDEAFIELRELAKSVSIDFIVTPFDSESAVFLANLVDFYKTGSGDLTFHKHLKLIASLKKPMLVSTGMADLGTVERAVSEIRKVMGENTENNLCLLHCTSSYPAPPESVNLRAIKTMETATGIKCGFSDHTQGIEIALAAGSSGAHVIEKHFTLDKSLPGPDHRASIEPDELAALSKGLKKISKAMGTGIKIPVRDEQNTAFAAKRSLVTPVKLKKGSVIDSGTLLAMRPGTGISPEYADIINGMKIQKDKEALDILTWDDFR